MKTKDKTHRKFTGTFSYGPIFPWFGTTVISDVRMSKARPRIFSIGEVANMAAVDFVKSVPCAKENFLPFFRCRKTQQHTRQQDLKIKDELKSYLHVQIASVFLPKDTDYTNKIRVANIKTHARLLRNKCQKIFSHEK